ncbi:TrkH family potassium uptake protein [Nonomuraea phyllanthi]|uniref:TrkH family potassium uptake protein n=1 Tax=Nonomuraea phyllanthi TaxID=2219224 RepID=A0A5C4VQP9_9ACTN|nr:potassium transporter TrkG [Nonomuraea phyllanthi]KAB8189787.1 TrkH family potassium uptake protein [Nonomuraea phyllanthi]QFY08742.1 TrkH family potassium uptake protein [Nonomuraea phyllanthi]
MMSMMPLFLTRFRHPAQVVVAGFGLAIALGTVLLALPVSIADGASADWLVALFTATSAVCVTGLVIVDTESHWSVFGEVVIAGLVQVGGLGIMTMATVFTLLVSGRLGLRARIAAQTETKTLSMSDVRRVVLKVVMFSLVCEAVTASVLTARFMIGYGEPFARATYLGAFHAVAAFNNSGFALWPDSIMRFVSDPWIMLTIAIAVIVGGLGFPVVFELARSWRHPRRWSVLTRITVSVTVTLLVLGTLVFLMTEWRNPRTLGALDDPGKLLAAFFTAVMPRSAGFNALDVSQMYPSSWLATDVLMFIGGGSAGTAGGLKVTTLGLLAFVVWAEMRGESRVNIGHRRLPEATQRQAVTITVLSVGLVALSTYVLLALTPHGLDQVLFEVVAAFGTAGLSTGITASLGTAGHLLIAVLMFIGRIGPLTMGSALALNRRARHYELPEERVIVG